MSSIKGKNTKPEIKLRKALWSIGLRYRIHNKKLPGTPDIVLQKYKLAIFVDGEFWHGKDWEIQKLRIKSNAEFWINKIEKNIQRDKDVNSNLSLLGYQIIRFWDSDIQKRLGACVRIVLEFIYKHENPPHK